MGNTWRSLLYIYYYLHKAGMRRPWERTDILFVMASGDDVTIFVDPRYRQMVCDAVLANTLRRKDDLTPTGLG
jgi:hypothetical protein